MPRNEPTEGTDGWDGEGSARRRKAARYAVPVTVAAVAAATIGLVPAFAARVRRICRRSRHRT